nr:O-antigen ligase family protein [uncultured Carboxylicivirga sp.]
MINKTKIIDYLLVYFLVAFSGIPFFYRSRIEVLIVFLFFPLMVFLYRKRKVDKYIIYYIAFALLIQAGQVLKFYYLPVTTFIGLHVRLLFAYLTLKAVDKRFVGYYVNILVISVIISWFFYFLSYHSSFEYILRDKIAPFFKHPFLKESNYNYFKNVILYTINTKGEGFLFLKRNSGPFWEPGAFSGFLIIALLFNSIRKKYLWNRKNVILILGLISTFSTTGLIGLLYVIISYYLVHQNVKRRIVFVPVLIVGVIYLFVSVDFIGDKIMRKLSFTDYTYNTRFKSAQKDIIDFAQSPFVGLGRAEKTRFGEETEERKIHRNNGVTNLLASYGIFAFFLYFILTWIGWRNYCRSRKFNTNFALFALGGIWLIGFSEVYFTKVFFISLTMLPVLYEPVVNEEEVEE